MRRFACGLLVLVAACGTPSAQEAPSPATAEGCARFDWPLDRERAWFAAPDLATVASGESLPDRAAAAILALKPFEQAGLPQAPSRQPKAGSFAGYVRVAAPPSAGRIQVTLSDEGWIDVAEDGGTALKPFAHSGRRDCAGLRKSLRFEVGTKPLVVAVSNAVSDTIRIAVAPVP